MRWWWKLLIVVLVLAALAVAGASWYLSRSGEREPSRVAFNEHCAHCHTVTLPDISGSWSGPALVGGELKGGDTIEALMASIESMHPDLDQQPWRDSISDHSIKALALYISERRQQWPTTADSYVSDFVERDIDSQHHRFRLELVTELAERPYAIAPLPDGRILVSEKVRGLSLVDSQGVQGELIAGTPRVWKEILNVGGSYITLGSMLDLALHPDYANNGWIYLSYSHRCHGDCGFLVPKTMVRVVRGRINDGAWVDEDLIWSVHPDYYTVVPDAVAAGRLAFDAAGHIYVTVGGKAPYSNLHKLDTPYGKIHRMAEDGSVPEDNPFYLPAAERAESSTRHTVFSYGHRTTQGLASDPRSGDIWSTEMGPRGGDEVNRIKAGGNYGWPLYTEGLDYDGDAVSIGEDLGLDYPFEDTVPPVLDFTPAPAISNLTFHKGDRFPRWENDLLIGSLKARTLYRVRVSDGEVVEQEVLATEVGRIRDVAMGADGLVYIAIEHGDGGALLRLAPLDSGS